MKERDYQGEEHNSLIQEIHDLAKELVLFSQKKGRNTMNEQIYINRINDLILCREALERGE